MTAGHPLPTGETIFTEMQGIEQQQQEEEDEDVRPLLPVSRLQPLLPLLLNHSTEAAPSVGNLSGKCPFACPCLCQLLCPSVFPYALFFVLAIVS